MKPLLVALLFALAALAFVPPSSAAAGPCYVNASNDTVCHVEVADCYVDTYSYDVEDALNHYRAGCLCVYYDNYGRPALRQTCASVPIATATAAALPVQCSLGPVTPGGDTHCEGRVAGCDVLVHIYDVEDALNRYQVDCGGCGVNHGGGPLVETQCYTPPPIAASAAAAPGLPLSTHCWNAEFGSGCATTVTTAVAACTYSSWTSTEGVQSADLSCAAPSLGSCSIGLLPATDPPAAGCDAAGPAASAAAADLGLDPADVCTQGIAQTWCDVTVGPCDVRVVPWTAWGDVYLVADCHVGGGAGATCHTEIHTQDPLNPIHDCAF